MLSSVRLWRVVALVLAVLIPVLGLAVARSVQPAGAPPATPRVIPVVVVVTPPPAPDEAPADAPPVAVQPQADAPRAAGAIAFAWRRDGHDDLYVLPEGATEPIRLTDNPGDDRDPAWSPDGRFIAFTSLRERNWDIYVLEVATGAVTRVTADPALDRRPAWSPDGNWLAFESYRLGNFDIFIASRDGREVYQVTGDPVADLAPAWSPDGRYIAFTSYRADGGTKDVWLADLQNAADERAVNLTNTPDVQEDDPAWSPDGELLAFAASGAGQTMVVTLPMAQGAVTGTPSPVAQGSRPAWSPDGRSVLSVFAPEDDPGQTYLLATRVRGDGVAATAFGGDMHLQGPSWTAAALPAAAGAGVLPAANTRELAYAAWLGQGMTDDGAYSVQLNVDLLDEVSPYWYTLDRWGGLIAYSTADDPVFTQFAHSYGLALYPTIGTQGDVGALRAVLADPDRRRAHVRRIVQRLEANGYDGIDVDYEGLGAADRDSLSLFIRELAGALHAEGLDLIVTVYAKTDETEGWLGLDSQDYPVLGRYADQIRIMAYEYHTPANGPGPVAPIYWQEQVLAYAVARVPAEKLVLGLHLYGTDWGSSGGSWLVYRDIDLTRQATGAQVRWDESAQEAYYSYMGRDGWHRVWFPNAQFVEARIALARRYGLRGICFWRVGGEDSAIWELLRTTR